MDKLRSLAGRLDCCTRLSEDSTRWRSRSFRSLCVLDGIIGFLWLFIESDEHSCELIDDARFFKILSELFLLGISWLLKRSPSDRHVRLMCGIASISCKASGKKTKEETRRESVRGWAPPPPCAPHNQSRLDRMDRQDQEWGPWLRPAVRRIKYLKAHFLLLFEINSSLYIKKLFGDLSR